MTHLKRYSIPERWPIPRKGTAYTIKPLANLSNTIPLLIILRDLLKIAQTRREVKRIIHLGHLIVNARKIKDEKISLSLFDTISIVPLRKNYRIELSKNGKFEMKEIKESEINFKIAKVINKKILKEKKIQLNLSDGRNFRSTIKCNINDSVLINLKESKIEKCVSLKENSKAIVISGKHSGEIGIIKEIDKQRKMIKLSLNNSIINVLIKQIMVIE